VNLREELEKHHERFWVIGLPQDYLNKKLTPLLESADWFLNSIISKGILSEKIDLAWGSRCLVASNDLLPVKKLLVVGLGKESELSEKQANGFAEMIDTTLKNLNENKPWIILSLDSPKTFVSHLKESTKKLSNVSDCTVSVG
jgi:hypothetical protein